MSDRSDRATVSSIEREVRHSLGDHAHLVAFDDDEDAEDFASWWLAEGEAAYLAWKAAL